MITHPEKVLFPDDGITKGDLAAYYTAIAPVMLPHLAGRPLNLQRFPNGADAPGFWQKDIPGTAPKWLTRWREEGVDGAHGPQRRGDEPAGGDADRYV